MCYGVGYSSMFRLIIMKGI